MLTQFLFLFPTHWNGGGFHWSLDHTLSSTDEMIPNRLWQSWDFLFSRNQHSLSIPQSVGDYWGIPVAIRRETHHRSIWQQWVKCHMGTGRTNPRGGPSSLYCSPQAWPGCSLQLLFCVHSVFIWCISWYWLIWGEFPSSNSWKNFTALFNHHSCCCRTSCTTGVTWQNSDCLTLYQESTMRSIRGQREGSHGREHGHPHSRHSQGLFLLHSREWKDEARCPLKKKLTHPEYIL